MNDVVARATVGALLGALSAGLLWMLSGDAPGWALWMTYIVVAMMSGRQ